MPGPASHCCTIETLWLRTSTPHVSIVYMKPDSCSPQVMFSAKFRHQLNCQTLQPQGKNNAREMKTNALYARTPHHLAILSISLTSLANIFCLLSEQSCSFFWPFFFLSQKCEACRTNKDNKQQTRCEACRFLNFRF